MIVSEMFDKKGLFGKDYYLTLQLAVTRVGDIDGALAEMSAKVNQWTNQRGKGAHRLNLIILTTSAEIDGALEQELRKMKRRGLFHSIPTISARLSSSKREFEL